MVWAVAAFSEMQVAKAEAREAAAVDQAVEIIEPVIVRQMVEIPEAEPVKAVESCPTAEPEVTVAENATVYPVPLDEELQLFIIGLCEEHHIDPAILFAMAERESNFNPDAIGDSGDASGMFQIQAKWHQARMDKLGINDLFDPYQNAEVAVDYLAELLDYYDGNMEKALVAYNMGQTGAYRNLFSRGIYSSDYSKAVIARWHDLNESLS